MTLTAGTNLGSYTIVAPLGAGGMGEVYRARDTKLGREVAIKVLPAEVTESSERLARFWREAQVLASLNHPHIATIHGLEEAEVGPFLVLELVEGEDLAARLKRGPIPVEEARELARQIAEALEEAHEKGIVHRDLKPANIMITLDGNIKVLDFGLAKALARNESATVDLSQSPTLTRASAAGVILGTAAYMSPEQASAKTVDKRSDIWSFGIVLWEMLVGGPVFKGESVAHVLAAVLRDAIDFDALPPNTPKALRTVIGRCLERNPRRRLRDIGEARIAIEDARNDDSPETLALSRSFRWLPWAVAAVAVVVAGFMFSSSAPRDQAVTRFTVQLPGDLSFGGVIALSPDGRQLVIAADSRLYLRGMDELKAMPIPGTAGGSRPFFSPDGAWLGFFTDTELKKVPTAGGPPQTVAAVPVGETGNTSGAWGSDGHIYFDLQGQTGIFRVAAEGGTPEPVTRLEEGDGDHTRPVMLPGGDAILFSVIGTDFSWDSARVEVYELSTGERKILLTGGASPRYVDSGHLLYSREGSLLALPFDVERRAVTGQPTTMLEGVQMGSATSIAQFSLAASGTMAFITGGVSSDYLSGVTLATLVWVDRDGREEPLSLAPNLYGAPRLSPDGLRVAVAIGAPGRDSQGISIADLERDTIMRLTYGADRHPVWTPDGERVVLGSGALANVYSTATDGTGELARLTDSQYIQTPYSFSPDGESFVLVEQRPFETGWDLLLHHLAEDRTEVLLRTPATERNAEISPDGRWIAYESDQTGRLEVYVRSFPDLSAGRWQVSTDGGMAPIWGRDGRELFYVHQSAIVSVALEMNGTVKASAPEVLFDNPEYVLTRTWNWRAFDLSLDGKRFLMVKRIADSGTALKPEIRVILNWTEELKRLVPAN